MSENYFQRVKNQRINYNRVGYSKEDIIVEDFTESIVYYDKNGNILKEERYTFDGSIDLTVINTYNEAQQVVSTSEYDNEGVLMLQVLSFYNEDKKMVEQKTQYGEDTLFYSSRFIFENGLLIRQEAYFEDCFEEVEKEFFYNEHRQLIEERHYDDSGEVQYLFKYQYNEKGEVIEMSKKELLVENILSGGNRAEDVRTYEFTYDSRGNQIKELIYNYDEALITRIYREYDVENRLTVEEEEDLDNYRKTVYNREGELLLKISIYNKQEEIDSWLEFDYDTQKRNIAMTQFIRDEISPDEYRILYKIERIYMLPDA